MTADQARAELMYDITELRNSSAKLRWIGDYNAVNHIRALGDRYLDALDTAREVSLQIAREMAYVEAGGRPLSDLSEASGLSVTQIEYLFMAVDVQKHLSVR